jgi:hypothetical protein
VAKGKLAIGFACPDAWTGASTFLMSLLATVNEDWRSDRRIKGRIIQVRSGPMIDQARNDIVRAFLAMEDDPEWLLMVDADMVWTPRDLRKLFEAADADERPVIGGLAFAGYLSDESLWPVLLNITPPDPTADPPKPAGIERIADYPRDTVCQVDATGAAFMLIHRRVLEQLRADMGADHPSPWFAISYLKGGIRLGEDVTMCMRLMKLGIPVHVHTGVVIGHLKTRVLDQEVYDQAQERLEAKARQRLKAVQ